MKFTKSNRLNIKNIGVIKANAYPQGGGYCIELVMSKNTKDKYFYEKYYNIVFKSNALIINKSTKSSGHSMLFNESQSTYSLLQHIPSHKYNKEICGLYSIDLDTFYECNDDRDNTNKRTVVDDLFDKDTHCYNNTSCIKIRCRECDIQALYYKNTDLITSFTSFDKQCIVDIIAHSDIIKYELMPDSENRGLYTYEVIISCDKETRYKVYFIKNLYELLFGKSTMYNEAVTEDNSYDMFSDCVKISTWNENANSESPQLVVYITSEMKKRIFNNNNGCCMFINPDGDIVLNTRLTPNCKLRKYRKDEFMVVKSLNDLGCKIKHRGIYAIHQVDDDNFVIYINKYDKSAYTNTEDDGNCKHKCYDTNIKPNLDVLYECATPSNNNYHTNSPYFKIYDDLIRVSTWKHNHREAGQLVLRLPIYIKNEMCNNANEFHISVNDATGEIIINTGVSPNCNIIKSKNDANKFVARKSLSSLGCNTVYNGLYCVKRVNKNVFILYEDGSEHTTSNMIESIYYNHFDIYTTYSVIQHALIEQKLKDRILSVKQVQINNDLNAMGINYKDVSCKDFIQDGDSNNSNNTYQRKRSILNWITFGKSKCANKR